MCCLQPAGHIAGHCMSAKARAVLSKHKDYWLYFVEDALLVHGSLIFAFFVTTWHSWLMLRQQAVIIPRSSPFGQLFPILYLCSWWFIHNWSTFHLPFNLVILDQIQIISCCIQCSLVTATWSVVGHRLIFCGKLFSKAGLHNILSVPPYSFSSTNFSFLSSDFPRFSIWWAVHIFLIHIIRPIILANARERFVVLFFFSLQVYIYNTLCWLRERQNRPGGFDNHSTVLKNHKMGYNCRNRILVRRYVVLFFVIVYFLLPQNCWYSRT